MGKPRDIKGVLQGDWLPLWSEVREYGKQGQKTTYWWCRCQCGIEQWVAAADLGCKSTQCKQCRTKKVHAAKGDRTIQRAIDYLNHFHGAGTIELVARGSEATLCKFLIKCPGCQYSRTAKLSPYEILNNKKGATCQSCANRKLDAPSPLCRICEKPLPAGRGCRVACSDKCEKANQLNHCKRSKILEQSLDFQWSTLTEQNPTKGNSDGDGY
jgi:hypothetical protein